MAGGVMTTGQANDKGRSHKRHRIRQASLRTEQRQDDHAVTQQEFARLMPGAADRLRQTMIATGSLGAASPPNGG